MKYIDGVVTLEYAKEKCAGCGRCSEVCPHGVFVMDNGAARITDKDRCIECGACQMNCAFGAINVQAGVGCASAVINSVLKGKGGSGACC